VTTEWYPTEWFVKFGVGIYFLIDIRGWVKKNVDFLMVGSAKFFPYILVRSFFVLADRLFVPPGRVTCLSSF
jgi:hypothetical protein